MASNLALFWATGPVLEGIQWIDSALEKVISTKATIGQPVSDKNLAKALAGGYLGQTGLYFPLGLNERAFEAAKCSIELCETIANEIGLTMAYGLHGLAGVSLGKREGPTLPKN